MELLRPLLITRVANCGPGGAVLLLGVWAASQTRSAAGLVLLAGIVGVTVMVRGYRMGVVVTGTEVVVRGLLRSRTVPRGAVLGVGTLNLVVVWLPAVRWRSASGKERYTPITAFGQATNRSALAFFERHRTTCVERLALLLAVSAEVRRRW